MAPPTNFDTTRIRFGEMVAAGAGLVLIISPFLDWYSISAKNAVDPFRGRQRLGPVELDSVGSSRSGLVAIGLAVTGAG